MSEKKGLNVVSYFNGMNCGMLALDKAEIKVDNYYSYEIDRYANMVSQKNYPNTKQMGSVVNADLSILPKIDLLIGGSPCQSFSIMGDGSGFDGKSGLFWEFVTAKEILKPKYWMLENVRMKNEWRDKITEVLGVEPIKIDSSLISTQRRNRYYWTNIPNIEQPKDLCLDFRDVIETNVDNKYFLTERAVERVREKQGFDLVKEKAKCLFATYYKNNSNSREGQIIESNGRLRRLTPKECEILQTVPLGYTVGVSDTQRYKMLGNGWTVDVIAHIFKGIE